MLTSIGRIAKRQLLGTFVGLLLLSGVALISACGDPPPPTPSPTPSPAPVVLAFTSTPIPTPTPTNSPTPTPTNTPTPAPTNSPTPSLDRPVLISLYHTTDGPNWIESGDWLSDRPIGEWYGVATDDEGRVIELLLGDNRLSGPVPAELGNLSKLQWLGPRRQPVERVGTGRTGRPLQTAVAGPQLQRVERADTGRSGQPTQSAGIVARPQRVERADTGETRQPIQSAVSGPRLQPTERADTGGTRQPLQPATSGPQG